MKQLRFWFHDLRLLAHSINKVISSDPVLQKTAFVKQLGI